MRPHRLHSQITQERMFLMINNNEVSKYTGERSSNFNKANKLWRSECLSTVSLSQVGSQLRGGTLPQQAFRAIISQGSGTLIFIFLLPCVWVNSLCPEYSKNDNSNQVTYFTRGLAHKPGIFTVCALCRTDSHICWPFAKPQFPQRQGTVILLVTFSGWNTVTKT